MRPDPSERLDERAVTVWRIQSLISVAVLGSGLLVLAVLYRFNVIPWQVLPVAAVALLTWGLLSVGLFPRVLWLRWRYEVLDTEIDLKFGLLIQKRTIIPMARVQHVDTKAGPLLRAFGLADVTIATAAGMHEIPGLSNEVADALRDRIALSAGMIEDVL
ncbi:MAG: PH domain-containing protein [Actinobacteria bacterium]|nr:PH domain-containing protein [Actinomycetota bacterium]MCL5887249.1 PH domain-containing protein [Actinomycetota bacterium]